MRARSIGGAIAILATLCTGVEADDKWEFGAGSDDTHHTPNQLLHGVVQTHDIEGTSAPTDRDFSFVAAKPGHSYEVRAFSASSCISSDANDECATLGRLALDGVTLVETAHAPDETGTIPQTGWVALRWTASADQIHYIRLNGYTASVAGAMDQYDIQMRDTTYPVPRWNSSGTQTTILLIQNVSGGLVVGSILFYDAGGALVHAQPLNVPARGLQVVSTAGVPALAGGSGSAAIVHDGSYGALAGKAVALEPSTGFTFDTAIAPIPY